MRADLIAMILRKDRLLAVLALAAVSAVAWTYTVFGVGMNMSALDMTGMPRDMPMPATDWNFGGSVLMFAMWWVMMVAMMLPSAAPMLLLYQRICGRRAPGAATGSTLFFALGYLLVWGGFSLAATVLHAVGELSGWIGGMMASVSLELDALLLVLAGVWQLMPMKARCLEACRTPVPFLSRIWRPGQSGALRMGVVHGAFCVGCCWAMMLLLFVGGVMNLYWIGGLALFVLAEKTVPNWPAVGRISGAVLIVTAGLLFLVG